MAGSLHNDADQTDVYQDLSSHLYRVLDVIGVSEEVREGYRVRATSHEILITAVFQVTHDSKISWYIFGSKYEGTTTLDMCSDIDVVVSGERLLVIENIADAPIEGEALLMLSEDTKPGYVNLQPVINRAKQTIYTGEVSGGVDTDTDHQGRRLVKHVHIKGLPSERHGPADTLPAVEGTGEKDVVHAYRCRFIPSFADEWLRRPRPYQWPSQEQLQRMGSYGCFIVGVGHPASRNKATEWRISFSLQERDLMSNLNPTQHKCYVLLKMIKKDLIQPKAGQSLSSYHCKTCIFHLSESHGVKLWTPNNLVHCVLKCLRLLLVWVRQENCPNYFIIGENMFDKLNKPTLTKLSFVLQELLSSGVRFLYEIKHDNLGTYLALSESDQRLEEKKLEVKQCNWGLLYMDMIREFLNAKANAYNFIDTVFIPSERLNAAIFILEYLKHMLVDIPDHTPRDVQMTIDMFIPYLHFAICQIKCSNEFVQMEIEKDDEAIQALAQEIQLCNHCDLISPRLMVASLYLHYGKLDSFQEILQGCETCLKPYVISACGCGAYKRYISMPFAEKIVVENLSFDEIRRECIAACMIFLPSEANLVPAALRYEMYRSVYTPSGSRFEDDEFWFDWIVVDSKVFLYFLQYILHIKTNNPAYKQGAIINLQYLINNKYENLGHRETALNLLGWIFTQENRVEDAFVCFRRSLAIRPLHNAAKWHLLMLIHAQMDTETIYDRKWFQ